MYKQEPDWSTLDAIPQLYHLQHETFCFDKLNSFLCHKVDLRIKHFKLGVMVLRVGFFSLIETLQLEF